MRFLFMMMCYLFLRSIIYGQCEDKSNNWIESWTSCTISANPNSVRSDSHWILYEFDTPHYIANSHIWNANRIGESGRGLKDVIIDYSLDGSTWIQLANYTFSQGTEGADYQGEEGPDFGSRYIRKILITVVSTHDGGPCASLAEILFNVDSTKCHGIVDNCGNCNGPGAATWYIDADGDGLGSDKSIIIDCEQPFGYVGNNDDVCDSGELGWAEVAPLFQTSCNGCHINVSAGGLSLASYEGFSTGGNICGSNLKSGNQFIGVITINGYNGCDDFISSPSMNQRTGSPLTSLELNKIQRWIDGGAPESCADFCLDDEDISQSFGSGSTAYRQVSQEIISTSKIENMTRIFFDAGQSIKLNNGFEVEKGGIFTAKLEGCN